MGKGKKKELQPKVNQVTLFLPTAFRQCAKIAVKQKLRPVTQSHSSLSTSTLTAVPRHGAQKKNRRSWMAASRPRRLRGLGSQLETACLPSGMQLDALDCFFCCSHSIAYTSLPLASPPPPPPTPPPPPSPCRCAPLHRCWNHYTEISLASCAVCKRRVASRARCRCASSWPSCDTVAD